VENVNYMKLSNFDYDTSINYTTNIKNI